MVVTPSPPPKPSPPPQGGGQRQAALECLHPCACWPTSLLACCRACRIPSFCLVIQWCNHARARPTAARAAFPPCASIPTRTSPTPRPALPPPQALPAAAAPPALPQAITPHASFAALPGASDQRGRVFDDSQPVCYEWTCLRLHRQVTTLVHAPAVPPRNAPPRSPPQRSPAIPPPTPTRAHTHTRTHAHTHTSVPPRSHPCGLLQHVPGSGDPLRIHYLRRLHLVPARP